MIVEKRKVIKRKITMLKIHMMIVKKEKEYYIEEGDNKDNYGEDMISIPFVPLEDVQAVFVSLIDNIEPDIMDLALHMGRTCIRRTPVRGRKRAMAPRFAPQIWNTYKQVLAGQHRITNVAEGWYNRFQKHIVTHHASVWKFIEFIKKNQRNNEIIIIQLLGGHLNVRHPIKRSYLQNLGRVEEIVRNYSHYNEEGHIRTYLKAISYHLKLYEDQQAEEIVECDYVEEKGDSEEEKYDSDDNDARYDGREMEEYEKDDSEEEDNDDDGGYDGWINFENETQDRQEWINAICESEGKDSGFFYDLLDGARTTFRGMVLRDQPGEYCRRNGRTYYEYASSASNVSGVTATALCCTKSLQRVSRVRDFHCAVKDVNIKPRIVPGNDHAAKNFDTRNSSATIIEEGSFMEKGTGHPIPLSPGFGLGGAVHRVLASLPEVRWVILRRCINISGYLASELNESDNAGEMSPGSSTDSYPAFAHIGLRENPGKNLNQNINGSSDRRRNCREVEVEMSDEEIARESRFSVMHKFDVGESVGKDDVKMNSSKSQKL
ncbi:hypothetical protein ANN_06251 [Periplaneta americana]|uniref:Uncharacterized protein n=1 Tax=Periplaneta americana TaxID=6978 RepID=A0ABQ8TD45_PERAM|nr:hypothetical protein ANN_06251 [Periplaneta americana]